MRNTAALIVLLLSLMVAAPAQTMASRLDADGAHWVESTLRKMTPEEKAGQLFMVWAKVEFMNPKGPAYQKLRDQMVQYHLGGFAITSPQDSGLLLRGSPLDAATLTNRLQRESPLPLLFAADFERGLPMRFRGGTGFPHAMAFGAAGSLDYAYQFGRVTAEEARAIGVHWNFYPDADVNSNPLNPIINTRAFGEDPAETSAMVEAFIRGAHDGHGMATAKHFPGHGDTDTDSHLAVSRVTASAERLARVELAPFRAAIAAGVDSVMVGHLAVPALEPDPNKVATLSANISTKLLQEEMGFDGIVVTDAMDMNGVTRIFGGNAGPAAGRAAVEALKAGADLILIPGDLDGAYRGVLEAIRSGALPMSRVDRSVRRLLRAKAGLGLHINRFVDLNAVNESVSLPENHAMAQRVADDALTVVRQSTSRPLLPLARTAQAQPQPAYTYRAASAVSNHLLVLVFTDDARGDNGRELVKEVRLRVPDARVMIVDEALAPLLASHVLEAAVNAERIVAAVYVTPSAGRMASSENGSPGLDRGPGAILGNVLKAAAAKTFVVSLGNPYLITQYPLAENYLCTFSNVPASEQSAVRFLFGEIPARGHLPVTIPEVAPRVPMVMPSAAGGATSSK